MAKNETRNLEAVEAQLKKYAADLAKVYRSEKQKRKELEQTGKQLLQYARDLKQTIQELKQKNIALQEAYLDTIHKLVLAAEYKDEHTGDHILRISRYSVLIGEKLGLSSQELTQLQYSATLHDIGKIGIPDNILFKPGKLTKREFEIMKTHTNIGANILGNSKSGILQMAEQIAISHHEKWNGEGYPHGLKGDKIPLVGRIVGIVDVFDALSSKRPYKGLYPLEITCDILRKERGEHFDPGILDLFLENLQEFLDIKNSLGGEEEISMDEFQWSERDLEDMV